jgi:hypothetical protein
LGGAGFNLAAVVREQRCLGYHAAPTALAINMHRVCVDHQTVRRIEAADIPA